MDCEARAAIEVLRNYRHLERRMAEIQERIARCHELATRATSSMAAGAISGTPGRSRVENESVKILDLERQMERTYGELVRKQYAIQAAIDAMPSEAYKRMLELRYLDGKTWEAIMRAMHLSRASSFRMHEAALINFYGHYQSPGE